MNAIDVRINVAALKADIAESKVIVKELFAELNQFSSANIIPVNLTGLQQLNESIKQQAISMDALVKKVAELGGVTQQYIQAATASIAVGEKSTQVTNQETAALGSKLKAQETLLGVERKATEEEVKKQKVVRDNIKTKTDENNANQRGIGQTQTQILQTQALNSQYKLLKVSVGAAKADYYELLAAQGENSVATKEAYQSYSNLSKELKTFEERAQEASSTGLASMSRSLTHGLSLLRTMAYILPGIGIAGIFNLAGEAITAVANELFKYNELLQDEIKYEQALYDIIISVNEARLRAVQTAPFFRPTTDLHYEQEALDVLKSQGEEYYSIQKSQQALYDSQVKITSQTLKNYTGVSDINSAYAQQLVNTDKLAGKLNQLNNIQRDELNAMTQELGVGNKYYQERTETRKKEIDEVQKDYEFNKKILDDYDNARTSSETTFAETVKRTQDDVQATRFNSAQKTIEEQEKINSLILSLETSSQAERIGSIQSTYNLERSLAEKRLQDVRNNNSSTRFDIEQAERNFNDTIFKLEKDRNEQVREVRLKFYVDFVTEEAKQFDKALETQNVGYDRIIKSDVESYGDRLAALSSFINNRRLEIEADAQAQIDLIKRTKPSDQQEQLITGVNLEKSNKLAALETQTQTEVTNVIQSWFSKQLQLIKQQNQLRESVNTQDYAIDLRNLNESLNKKIISWKDYLIQRKALQDRLLLSNDREAIDRDKDTIDRLLQLKDDIQEKLAQNQTDFQDPSNTEADVKKYQEVQKQLLQDRTQVDIELKNSRKQLADDDAKFELDQQKRIEEGERQLAQNRKEIITGLFSFAAEAANSYYENQEEKLRRQEELTTEMYDNEQEAIQESTLSQKDKHAYEVQLSQQKAASDKKFAQQERKLQHDQAAANRDVKIAEIILNTEQAITKAYAEVPWPLDTAVAISYGILGGIALAKAIATKIPSYEHGGVHPEDSLARMGEKGKPELVKEPRKQPYWVFQETIKWIPKGTEIVPMHKVEDKPDTSWEQTRFLARIMGKSKREINNTIHTHVNIDFGFLSYKDKLIYGR